MEFMVYNDCDGLPKGKSVIVYLFNDRILIAKTSTKGFGTMRKVQKKFQRLEDLSLVRIEQYNSVEGFLF